MHWGCWHCFNSRTSINLVCVEAPTIMGGHDYICLTIVVQIYGLPTDSIVLQDPVKLHHCPVEVRRAKSASNWQALLVEISQWGTSSCRTTISWGLSFVRFPLRPVNISEDMLQRMSHSSDRFDECLQPLQLEIRLPNSLCIQQANNFLWFAELRSIAWGDLAQ